MSKRYALDLAVHLQLDRVALIDRSARTGTGQSETDAWLGLDLKLDFESDLGSNLIWL